MKFQSHVANLLDLYRERAVSTAGRCHVLVVLDPVTAAGPLAKHLDADGAIILSIGHTACGNYEATETGISFEARFDGVPHQFDIKYFQIVGLRDDTMPATLNGTPLSSWIPLALVYADMVEHDRQLKELIAGNVPVAEVPKERPSLKVVK